jgi:predicted RNA-binding protein with PUA-like domain
MDERSVVGIMRITGAGQPDGEDGSWVKVPVEPVRPLAKAVTLAQIKAEPELAKMELIRQSRLSVAPVREDEWKRILEMGK